MLFTILALILVAYLPGAAALRVPVLDRDRRAALDAEERFFWAVVISIAWSSLVALALAAAGRYTFTWLLAADGAATASIALAFRHRLRYGGAARRPGPTLLLPLALAGLGCWLFFPPFERVIGGQDPGVYINEGIALAQRGAFVFRDAVVSSMPAAVRDLFFPSHHNPFYYSLRFMGFFVLDPGRGLVVGQFPHLYPAWIAIGYALGGLRGALATTPVAAVLGLVAVYFAGARLLGRGPALVAGILLALNVATIWFAREPNSDILAQALLFAALFAFARAHVDGDRFFAPVAAALLGLLLFLRIESALAVGAVAAVVALQVLERRRPLLLFVLPLVLLVGAATLYLHDVLPVYFSRPVAFAQGVVSRFGAVPLALAAAVVAVLAVTAGFLGRREAIASRLRWAAPRLLALAVLAAAVYAYFFRMPGGRLAWQDARSLETFTWYFPPIALALALLGFVLVARRSFWRDPGCMVAFAVYCFAIFYKVQIVPDHFWAARRFVPMILPGACLFAAAGLFALAPARRHPVLRLAHVRTLLACGLFVFVAVQLVRADRAVAGHVQHAGIIARMDALAARFRPDDLVVVNPRDASDIHVLAPPLEYIWNRPAVVLNSPKPDKAMFREFLDWARGRYRHVYFLGGGGTDLISTSIAAEPVFSDRFQVAEYESRRNAYPREVRRKEFDFGVYRFIDPGTRAGSFALDIGRLDDLNVVRFHAKERSDGLSFRWSRDSSYIALPRVDGAKTLTLWMNAGGRPAQAPRAHVAVYLEGRLLGETDVASGFAPYAFSIQPEIATAAMTTSDSGAVTVRLVSTTWKPREILGTPDDRDLGVMVHRIEVK